jgi:hypothetical protein
MTTRRKLMGLVAALAVLTPLLMFLASCKTMTDKEVKNAIQTEILETKWVMKEFRQWPNPKLILVPSVVFRIKNLTADSMAYVSFNGIFKERNAVENRGDNFLAAIGKNNAVAPGGWSDPITLKSNYGTEGTSVKAFQNNPQWKPVWVKIYALWKGSRHVLLGEWPISMTIDFKEPEQPVIQGGKKEGEVKKDETKK